MEESFDPYLEWLGIRDEQRPPNHYRLLGVEPFENDPKVIASAADGDARRSLNLLELSADLQCLIESLYTRLYKA